MISKDEILNHWIPYRLESIRSFREAMKLANEYGHSANTQVIINGEVKLSGTLTLVTNPLIEIGIIHARSLFEFMGITLNKHGKLIEITRNRKIDDMAIEHCKDSDGIHLKKVKLEDLYKNYPGSASEVEHAFATMLKAANKGIAHITQSMCKEDSDIYDLAARGLPVLIESHLYIKMGKTQPSELF